MSPMDEAEVVPTISEHAGELADQLSDRESELSEQIANEMPAGPTQQDVDLRYRYFTELRTQLKMRVSEIETFLGFVPDESELAVRVARLEKFVGIK